MSRRVSAHYLDPLEAVWVHAARNIGLSVERASDTYASTDGRGRLLLSDAAGMDPDDCLAQMILHELCHALVQGPHLFGAVDWGLDNETDRDVDREHACLRLQAALLEPLGLRQVLAPTTDYRDFYDALPPDPFQPRTEHEHLSIALARAAYARRHYAPFGPHLEEALLRTERIASELAGLLASQDAESVLLFSRKGPLAKPHPTGLPSHPDPVQVSTCVDCAWASSRSQGRLHCRQAGKKTPADARACERFEPALACQACGACCREAFDVVVVGPREALVESHPELLRKNGRSYDLPRPDGRCVALTGGVPVPHRQPAIGAPSTRSETARKLPLYLPDPSGFACQIYADRPRTCRDFERGSTNCLAARRSLGLSR